MSKKRKRKNKKTFSRRKFFKRSAIVLGGTAVLLIVGKKPGRRFIAKTAGSMPMPSGIQNFKPEFWFEVLADSTILLKSAKVEMGQGVFTGLAMLAAEELEVSIDQIKVVPASTVDGPIDMSGTGGSSSTASLYEPVREVAARLREMMRNAAAEQWGVEPSAVDIKDGEIISGNQSTSYGALMQSVTEWKVPKTPTLKPASEFKYIGKEMPRVDLRQKVMGESIFAIDTHLPDMQYACVLSSPFIGGKLKSVDSKDAKAFPGVLKIVEQDDVVAVVAENRYAAEMGKRLLKAEWDVPKQWQQADLEAIVTVGNGKAVSGQKRGNASQAVADADENGSKNVIRAEYRTPLGVHAQMEPNGTVAHFDGDKLKLYAGTQSAWSMRKEVAKNIGLKTKNIEIHNNFLGGGFGRRYFKNNWTEAAIIAKAIGKPVHVFRDREDEFMNGYFRPCTHHVFSAALDDSGKLTAITHDLGTADMILLNLPMPGMKAIMGADFLSAAHGARWIYDIENRTADVWQNELPFQTGIWRGVGMFANTFATECFMDECAHKAGVDPVAFRLRYLNADDKLSARIAHVLERAVQHHAYNQSSGVNTGRGVACCEDRNTPVAAVVDVVMEDNKIRITRITQAIDPGIIINPEGIRQQVEGATMMGISATLYEATYVKDSQFTATNYHQYPMAMLKDTPQIDVVMIAGDERPSGVGEPPIAPVAPAIANAVFNLTGKRLRRMPLQDEWEES